MFSSRSFSSVKMFIVLCDHFLLVMSSSFCRRPDSQIISNNFIFIVGFL